MLEKFANFKEDRNLATTSSDNSYLQLIQVIFSNVL